MVSQTTINELKIGDKLDHFLLLAKLEIKQTKTGKKYLDIDLKDKSSVINGKVWDGFEKFLTTAQVGEVVKVSGTVEEFNSQKQLRIVSIRSKEDNDDVSADDFIPRSKRNLNEMVQELKSVINSVDNPHLQKLVTTILLEERFLKYTRVPAGKAWHHAYLHGLLEHTLEIVKICDLMCGIHKSLNRDLLISGALLHDLGKTEELKDDASFDYTDKGKLIGHIVIAATEIEIQAGKIENFPGELKNQLIHLVLSHQGKLEYASPVEPKTVEAIVLYQADELSAKTNAYLSAVNIDKENETGWTRYLPLAGTSLKLPDKNENNDEIKTSLFD